MKMQQRTYERRTGLLWPCVLLASVLPDMAEEQYLHGVCYVQIYRVLNTDGEYLARIAADPDDLGEGATYVLTEEQLWYACPLDTRLSTLTPARLRTLLKECGDDLRPPQALADPEASRQIFLSEQIAEESGAFSREALRLAEVLDQEKSIAAPVQPQQEKRQAPCDQVPTHIQSLYLPYELLRAMLAAHPLPMPPLDETHLKKCLQCRRRWLDRIKSRLPYLLAQALLPVITSMEQVYHTFSKEVMHIIQGIKESYTVMRPPQVALHLSTGYKGRKNDIPSGWLIGLVGSGQITQIPSSLSC